MIKPIVTDQMFLQQVAQPAQKSDLPIAQDLKDTLLSHQEECVGMAANMIGINKAVIIAMIGPLPVVMFNPQITSQQQAFETSEGCLSLPNQHHTTRYQRITVRYLNEQWTEQSLALEGFAAQIVQHEIDHLKGILI